MCVKRCCVLWFYVICPSTEPTLTQVCFDQISRNIYKQASGLMKVLFLPILTNFTFTIAELWDFFRKKKKKAISGDNLSLL